MVVNEPVLDASYTVTNLNIVRNNGVESYFLTKYIPTDGKPFYNYADFVGTIQYLDLDGNILTSSFSNKNETIMVYVGCTMIEINGCTCDGQWTVVGSYNICSGSSGGGGTTTGGTNGGYTPGTGGGGGGGTGGSPTQPNIPNIPSEDVVEQKRFKSFLLTQLTQEEVDILITNQNLSDHIFNYQKNKNFSPASWNNSKWFMNFFAQTPDAEPFSIFDFGTKFIDENTGIVNPNNVFLRAYALDKFLVQNPDGLINVSCYELEKWKEVANHPIPVSVKNKLYQLNTQGLFTSAQIQNIELANAPRVNMDLFPVKITNMPYKSPGVKYTPAQFFDYFRKNINTLIQKPDLSQFYPAVYPNYGINDTALWNSDNPIKAILTIDIPFDPGSVICTGFGPKAWVFSTIISPWDGLHPVNGNRLFGYFEDANGGMTIYTRGVDRFTSLSGTGNNLLSILTLAQESYAFSQADELWESLQGGIKKFVKDNGGGENGAEIIQPTIYRPSWTKISGFLKGNTDISSLGCY
ncbi:hypothetical protein [Chryseobacterium salivictor]|uniref:Uncharacterized protein n=1 Tax=Chryseobacterium salivictor TaxID=2547600 RepID=A0A4P6ZGS2_9FLAO|nr:hypothetical protein [Chryseobacterium salivictor]QBO58799.1 hypothetical protein NBC122_01991 [Chryseobacterium salivictor]